MRAVARASYRFGRDRVDARNAHGVSDGAKPAHRLNRAAEILRGDRAGLRQAFAQSTQGLLIETRQWRAADLIIDNEAHGIGANVDNGVGRPVEATGALRIEIDRTHDSFVCGESISDHPVSSSGHNASPFRRRDRATLTRSCATAKNFASAVMPNRTPHADVG
jgi:hypothetical protein